VNGGMGTDDPARRHPNGRNGTVPSRATSMALTIGVLLSAICFLVAGAFDLLVPGTTASEVRDLPALIAGLVDLQAWAWAGLGTIVVIATPAVGLVVTATEYAVASDRRTAGTALAVLGVLAISLAAAILR
jgi:uncharacterized membrane protein